MTLYLHSPTEELVMWVEDKVDQSSILFEMKIYLCRYKC